MKRNCLVLIFLFMLLLTASALALTADVTIKIDGRLPAIVPGIYKGQDNIVEIWFTNSAKLKGFSLGLEFSGTCPFTLVQPFGNVPEGAEIMQEQGTVNNNFLNTFGGLNASWTPNPPNGGLLFFGGADVSGLQTKNLFAHLTSTFGYSIKVNLPAGPGAGSFDIKPVFVPPGGSWKMDAGLNIDLITGLPSGDCPPDFQGVPTGSSADPQGLVQFVCDVEPCAVPEITGPGAVVSSSHSGFSFPFTKTDGEVPPSSWTPAPTVGSITTGGVYTLTPNPVTQFCQGSTAVTVYASNGCPTPNNVAAYPFTINWTNATPDIDCPLDMVSTPMAATYSRVFAATDADPGDAASLIWAATQTSGPVPTTPTFSASTFSFYPPVDGIYTFLITATDVCGAVDECIFVVEAVPIRFNIVKIPKLGEGMNFVFQGTYTTVPVEMGLTTLRLAGYNLLIKYDASALSFVSATIGPDFGPCPNGSGWEYFTYRFGADGNCGGPCPSGLLRLVALAETNNGPNHPGCPDIYGNITKDPYDVSSKVLANLKFYVTNDRTFECQYTEIGFAWIDCSDNSFSDTSGNRLYIAGDSAVHTFEWDSYTHNDNLIPCTDFPNIIGVVYGGFCVPDCQVDPLKPVYAEMYFMNGGIDIACANDIDARGDINLNGISNEIADAVLFTNFFLKGITAFYDPPSECGSPENCARRVQGKVAATDVNADGHPLTVGDLVYLLRIIVGDALAIPKLSPFATSATVNFANGSVTTESGTEIGGVYATFAINGAYDVTSNTDMKVEFGEVNGELKVLVYSGTTNMSNRIASGTNELFTVSGDVELKSVEVADYYGNMLNTRVNKISLPTSFALSQNVPNPFNPTTKLGFALPNQTEWTLSIYNVAGQLVKSFSGNNIGNVSVEWDASMASSGVYFYKLNAGSFSDTKKMVLMK